jgi:hypothetical protein
MSTRAAIPSEEVELNKAYRGGLPLSSNLLSDSGEEFSCQFAGLFARWLSAHLSAGEKGDFYARPPGNPRGRDAPVVADKYGASYDSASRGGTRVG